MRAILLLAAAAGVIAAVVHAMQQEFWPTVRFAADDIPDMAGRTVLVTGANSGLGLETAYHLAARGATVVMACRSVQRGEQAAAELRARAGARQLELRVMELDLGSLASVQRFAQAFTAQFSRLHVLVANAGLMGAAELSEDGLEMEFAVNHLGHHFLTKLLMPTLKRSAPSRVVVVASAIYVASFGQLFLDNVRRPAELHALVRYARSKFANILFASTLARRLEASEGVLVNSLHPGCVVTQFGRNMDSVGTLGAWVYSQGERHLFLDVHTGALTMLYAASSPEVESQALHGEFFAPVGVSRGRFDADRHVRLGDALWNKSEELLCEAGYCSSW